MPSLRTVQSGQAVGAVRPWQAPDDAPGSETLRDWQLSFRPAVPAALLGVHHPGGASRGQLERRLAGELDLAHALLMVLDANLEIRPFG